MANTLIEIAYDGTGYSGFQIQENALTIQELLESSLSLIYKEPIRLTGAGRTDAGVHARGQIAMYKAPFLIESDSLPLAINASLPLQIVVTSASVIPDYFHVRYDAVRKVYSYTVDRLQYPQIFLRRYSWHLPGLIDTVLLRKAAAIFPGTHDFKNYQVSGNNNEDTIRTIYSLKVEECEDSGVLKIWYEGSGFLYRMVRLITGTLIRAGEGKVSLNSITESLSGDNKTAVGPTAPAKGLCLEKVIFHGQ